MRRKYYPWYCPPILEQRLASCALRQPTSMSFSGRSRNTAPTRRSTTFGTCIRAGNNAHLWLPHFSKYPQYDPGDDGMLLLQEYTYPSHDSTLYLANHAPVAGSSLGIPALARSGYAQ